MSGKCLYIPFKNETDFFLESATQLYPCIYFIVYAPARRLLLRFEIDLLTRQLIHLSTTATASLSLVA